MRASPPCTFPSRPVLRSHSRTKGDCELVLDSRHCIGHQASRVQLKGQNGASPAGLLCLRTQRNVDNCPQFTTLNGCRASSGTRLCVLRYPPARLCAHLQVSPVSRPHIRQDSLPNRAPFSSGPAIDLASSVLDNTAHHTPTPTPAVCPCSAPASNVPVRSSLVLPSAGPWLRR